MPSFSLKTKRAWAPSQFAPAHLPKRILGSEVACYQSNALTLFLSSAATSLIPSTQNQGTRTRSSNNLTKPSAGNTESSIFLCQQGSLIQAGLCSWETRGAICVSWSAMCTGMPCCLENHDGMIVVFRKKNDGMIDNNNSGVSIVSLTVQNCSYWMKGNSRVVNIFHSPFAFIESLLRVL